MKCSSIAGLLCVAVLAGCASTSTPRSKPMSTTPTSTTTPTPSSKPCPEQAPRSGEVAVLVRVTAKPGLGDTVADRFRNPQSRCTREVGCLGFEIFRVKDDPERVVVLERWASIAAHREFFTAATSGPRFQSFLELTQGDFNYEYLSAHPPAEPAAR